MIDDRPCDDVVLWSDTAPDVVTANLQPQQPSKAMILRVWNAWRDPAGVMQAWIGDAGIVVDERSSGEIVLCCSDGFDAPLFDNLVIRLMLRFSE